MKWLFVFILCIIHSAVGYMQVFHFADSSVTIQKTIAQSPAHWYIEIFNDQNVKDTLRWRSHFQTIPPQWEIMLDTQSGIFNPVMDGDSADFILLDSLSFPQKLIVGALTNSTPGHGSVFFDIYDPGDPSTMVTIEYEFIITEENAGIEEEVFPYLMYVSNKILYTNSAFSFKISVFDLKGSILHSCSGCGILNLEGISSGVYIVSLQTEQKEVWKKIIVE